MRQLWGLLLIVAVTLSGCGGSGGGGGGGGNGTVIGRVFNVLSGGPPNPAATVQIGTNSVNTSLSDGSFQLGAKNGTTSLTVDNGVAPLWQFTIDPVSGNTDVGDLWVGPERVTLTGVVRNATNEAPIPGAQVRFAGRRATTNASGVFAMNDVAYASSTQTAFWGILGSVDATGFFRQEFSAQPFTAVSGVVDIGSIRMTPTSDPTPPGVPFNVWGVISAPGGAAGAVVRLKQGGIDVRVFNVGADARYAFFVAPGTYTISASKGASTAPDVVVTLSAANEEIRRDIAIP